MARLLDTLEARPTARIDYGQVRRTPGQMRAYARSLALTTLAAEHPERYRELYDQLLDEQGYRRVGQGRRPR